MRPAHKFVAVGLCVVLLVLGFIVTLPRPVSADSNQWTSDTDWLSGTMDSNVVLKGTGPAAWLELRKGDFPDWMKMAPSTVPAKRDGACLAWVDTDNSFIMYGGYGTAGYLGDTWKYNFTNDQWVDISPVPSPSPRWRAGCAYDPFNKAIIM